MRSGVSRARVRLRRPWRMISCPAAKQIRWVNPSIATVSPSRTRSPTASRIVARLELIRRPAVVRAAEDAELVPLGIPHLRPERPALLDVPADRPAQPGDPFDLLGHRPRRPDVEVDAVLDGLRLGDGDEREHRIAVAITDDLDAALTGIQQHIAELAVPERGDPEIRHPAPVAGVDDDRIDPASIPLAALRTGPQDAELIAFRISHHGPRTVPLVDVPDLRGPEITETRNLLRHRRGRPQIEVDAVLHDL